jgi:hypothetical protein
VLAEANVAAYADADSKGGKGGPKKDGLESAIRKLRSSRTEKKMQLVKGKRYLLVKLHTGKGFVDLDDGPEGAATLTCVVYFRERKFTSEPVEYEVNPDFDGTFLIPLQNEHDDQRMLSVNHLRESADAMHLMVVRESREGRQVCVCVCVYVCVGCGFVDELYISIYTCVCVCVAVMCVYMQIRVCPGGVVPDSGVAHCARARGSECARGAARRGELQPPHGTTKRGSTASPS